ncbi:MAG: hypothetical protein MEQ07_04655 [Aquimonas sp.]|nr:hypothetical protein [Aquimonas sp.]
MNPALNSTLAVALTASLWLVACSSDPDAGPPGHYESTAEHEPDGAEEGARDEAYYLARHPEIASREGAVLTVRIGGGEPLVFEDNPEPGEGWGSTEFLGTTPGHPFVLLMQGYLEGGYYSLINIESGQQERLDSPPVFSPDGRWLLSSSMDLEAGFFPNRIAIHQVSPTGAPLVWELGGYDMDWGPEDTRWIDAQTVAYTRISRHWRDDGVELWEREPKTVSLIDGQWVHD